MSSKKGSGKGSGKGLFGLGLVSKIGNAVGNRVVQSVAGTVNYYSFESLLPSPFESRNGNRVTLYHDAHSEDNPTPFLTDYGTPNLTHVPQNCFEDIYEAILNAKLFIYITGWSVDTKITLIRRPPSHGRVFPETPKPANEMTIGELLKYKVQQGVRVYLHVWDEALSMNIGDFKLSGIMCTYDEETYEYFKNTGVICKLSYRTGTSTNNQFLWTHHQKTIICDAEAIPENLRSSGSITQSQLYSFKDSDFATSDSYYMSYMNRLQSIEASYSVRNEFGYRFAIVSFMTSEHEFIKLWDDTGSTAMFDAAIFRPKPSEGWHILGDFCERSHSTHPGPMTKVMVVKEPPLNPNYPPILAPPVDYRQVWPASGVYKSKYGPIVFWEPVPPPGYEALGYIISDSVTKPDLNIIRCVHHDAVLPAHAVYEENHKPLWRNKAGRASLSTTVTGGPEMSVWNLVPSTEGLVSGSFVVRGGSRLPLGNQDLYFCLRVPPQGVDVCPKPSDFQSPYASSHYTFSDLPLDFQKRRVIAFVGGLDLTYGRWDTPAHPLYRTLDNEHAKDYLHGWALNQAFGPREPWHDIHSRLEGPVARDVMINFEQRWRRQAKTPLPNFSNLLVSIQEEEISDDESWQARICRSIDPFSADIPRTENSIQHAYVCAIRRARKFIYIENQYFMGSSRWWLHDRNTACINLIPFEIANRIAESIREGYAEPVCAYILIPLYPEGYPADAAIQEQLRWQWNTIVMMYHVISDAIRERSLGTNPLQYLKFLCVGQRETIDLSRASRADPPAKSREAQLFASRRVPIYVHSKLMIVDDEYIILGSANINERSMSGDRDSEICVEAWQPKYLNNVRTRGKVHEFRMSIWQEHTNYPCKEFLEPNSPACSFLIDQIANANWDIFNSFNEVVNMSSHLMRYPITVEQDGTVHPFPVNFPDTSAPVKGTASLSMPDLLTT